MATAPKMPRFITTAVLVIFSLGQPITSGGTAAISISPVVSPWAIRPAMKKPGAGDQAVSTEPTRKSDANSSSSLRTGSRMVSCTASTVPNE